MHQHKYNYHAILFYVLKDHVQYKYDELGCTQALTYHAIGRASKALLWPMGYEHL